MSVGARDPKEASIAVVPERVDDRLNDDAEVLKQAAMNASLSNAGNRQGSHISLASGSQTMS